MLDRAEAVTLSDVFRTLLCFGSVGSRHTLQENYNQLEIRQQAWPAMRGRGRIVMVGA
jgi:hypothetical protein